MSGDDESSFNDGGSGGSSPFLDTPLEGPEAKLNEESLNKESSVVGTDYHSLQLARRDEKIGQLESRLSDLTKEFELAQLQLQDDNVALQNSYQLNVEELEKVTADLKFTQEINDKLNIQYNELRSKLGSELQGENKDSHFEELDLQLKLKDQEIERLNFEHESHISKLGFEMKDMSIELNVLRTKTQKLETELQTNFVELKESRKLLVTKQDEIDDLQRLNAQYGQMKMTDLEDEMTTVNQMLQDQVKYTMELEKTNLEQADELKKLRAHAPSDNSGKRTDYEVNNESSEYQALKKEHEDLQLEMLSLKSKLSSWEVYMEKDTNLNSSLPANGSPEEIIHDWKVTKQENTALIDENSKLTLAMSNFKLLNEELAMERNQLLRLNKDYESNIINMKRLNHELEQQNVLFKEECKILRKQMDDFTNLSSTNGNGNNQGVTQDTQKKLENLIDDYKNKTDDLTNELQKVNNELLQATEEEQNQVKKRKRSIGSGDNLNYYSKRINELQLEVGKLTRDLNKYRNLNKLLDDKLKRLITLKEKKIRILQLRDNPLSRDQFIKKEQLQLLKQEKVDLLEQLQSSNPNLQTLPISVYQTLEFDFKQREKEILRTNKKFLRLKEIFNKKSLEFIDVVNSILGFRLEFQQNNKVKIYSCFQPDAHLVVDLVKNTLVSNISLDNWESLMSLWVVERGQVPCFLAAITLQLWEKQQQHTA
ncbi:coiled-coil domain-containing protein MAD1 KNAG_0F02120 [Huiozyma naganishii CBS 8797]|uniref:Spindle assembly checkpoint component MAD1 n=1 Tax=Huiozyma naganishii (strain ATCC MYA-139 / BCRC 22969 / CBS 8797 / KCTC 17520 / NBRC 10181 / NCYC 3082 / Yp74L-3) TaxID=1071383 RepID=J7S7B4_HUIN7|nr:hypothetical protein KNAG_0F02120 [Kazachstania naganishii CBS 8797]CCK70879.1 hypothetical protein KNAG_0F02120 [Kazachstania naganishii CBS 8797]